MSLMQFSVKAFVFVCVLVLFSAPHLLPLHLSSSREKLDVQG